MKRNKKQQAMIRAIAVILALGLIIMSMGYLMYAFAEPVYAAEFFWGEEADNKVRLQGLESFIDEIQENYKDEVAPGVARRPLERFLYLRREQYFFFDR